MILPPEPSEQEWQKARDALQKKQDSRYQADLDQIAFYELAQRLLRQPDGLLRPGARSEVECRLGVGKSLSRYIESANTEQMRRVLEERRQKELAARAVAP
ncbi:hypothetical protein [Streptosporangium sp. NPDC002721]|uniref:hypothetical protein n=1 Tax=Streptosporangium sp. NPDC002721 TaxID=3366188 RepID=UPI00369C2267